MQSVVTTLVHKSLLLVIHSVIVVVLIMVVEINFGKCAAVQLKSLGKPVFSLVASWGEHRACRSISRPARLLLLHGGEASHRGRNEGLKGRQKARFGILEARSLGGRIVGHLRLLEGETVERHGSHLAEFAFHIGVSVLA